MKPGGVGGGGGGKGVIYQSQSFLLISLQVVQFVTKLVNFVTFPKT